jgi:hypothetical protein
MPDYTVSLPEPPEGYEYTRDAQGRVKHTLFTDSAIGTKRAPNVGTYFILRKLPEPEPLVAVYLTRKDVEVWAGGQFDKAGLYIGGRISIAARKALAQQESLSQDVHLHKQTLGSATVLKVTCDEVLVCSNPHELGSPHPATELCTRPKGHAGAHASKAAT